MSDERILIDARGSIDSRTFDTEGRISSVVKDERDRHDPIVDLNASPTHWHSKAGQGFAEANRSRPERPVFARGGAAGTRLAAGERGRVSNVALSGRRDLWQPAGRRLSSVPLFFKVSAVVIAVLLAIVLLLALT